MPPSRAPESAVKIVSGGQDKAQDYLFQKVKKLAFNLQDRPPCPLDPLPRWIEGGFYRLFIFREIYLNSRSKRLFPLTRPFLSA